MGTRQVAITITLAAAVAGLGSRPAAAQDVMEERDFPVERFRLSLDRGGLFEVEGGSLPTAGSWEFSLWMGASDDPLVLYSENDDERVGSLVSARVGGDLGASLVLLRWLQIGANLPLIVYQDRTAMVDGVDGQLESINHFGVGDLRVSPKAQLLRQDDHGADLAIVPELTIPSGSSEDYRGEASFSFAPMLAVSRSAGAFRLALNLGWLIRERSRVANLVVDDELFARAGAGYRIGAAELAVNLSASTAAADPVASANRNHMELLGALTYDVGDRFQVFAGGGIGLNEGFGTPDWRGLAGLRIGRSRGPEGPSDRDRDGIFGVADLCPDAAEDFDQFEDPDGCPDPDNDQDEVLDVADGAPLVPEDRDGWEDDDGVPEPDNDHDEITDGNDPCPDVAENLNQYKDDDGCPEDIPDSDGDGQGDNVDGCPTDAEDFDGFEDDDGCPELDNDQDGVVDTSDGCPLVVGPIENRGCPDTDRDDDGVIDRLDNCPDERGKVKNHGCKDKQLVVLTGTRLDILDVVYFKLDKDIIEKRSFKLLDNVARVIVAHPEIKRLRIGGHTDDVGDDTYNLDLSQRRANAVMAYLVNGGVAQERLEARGYGEGDPVATNKTRKGRAANRRVVFDILGDAGGDGTDPLIEMENSGPSDDTVEAPPEGGLIDELK